MRGGGGRRRHKISTTCLLELGREQRESRLDGLGRAARADRGRLGVAPARLALGVSRRGAARAATGGGRGRGRRGVDRLDEPLHVRADSRAEDGRAAARLADTRLAPLERARGVRPRARQRELGDLYR